MLADFEQRYPEEGNGNGTDREVYGENFNRPLIKQVLSREIPWIVGTFEEYVRRRSQGRVRYQPDPELIEVVVETVQNAQRDRHTIPATERNGAMIAGMIVKGLVDGYSEKVHAEYMRQHYVEEARQRWEEGPFIPERMEDPNPDGIRDPSEWLPTESQLAKRKKLLELVDANLRRDHERRTKHPLHRHLDPSHPPSSPSGSN